MNKVVADEIAFDPFLRSLGWSREFQDSYAETDLNEFFVGRIMGQGKGHYHLQLTVDSTQEAAITKKFHDSIHEAGGFPTVGDWVTYKPSVGSQMATIHRVLKRKNLIQRLKSGSDHEMQLIAANIDHMCIVTSCNEDFDLSRLNRYVALSHGTDARPILLLTKSDLSPHAEKYVDQLKAEFESIQVISLSSETPETFDQLKEFFAPGKTTVLLGSSGVGKSTLTNSLLGFDSQKTQGVSAESKGRHTTTARNLRFTKWGGIVIDTPGMQEIAERSRDEEIQEKFADLEELALKCKFTNCLHAKEPGCAIRSAISSGQISQAHWDAYLTRLTKPQRSKPKRQK